MKITKRQLRRIIKEEKAKLIAEQSDPGASAAEGLKAIADIYSAVDRLDRAIEDTARQVGGSHRNSMNLAKSSVDDMQHLLHLDRVEDRLKRIVDLAKV